MATALTSRSWPANECRSRPVSRSQSLTVRSREPERAWPVCRSTAIATHRAFVPVGDWRRLAGDQIPELDGAVSRAREGVAPVGGERHVGHIILVAREVAEEQAALQIPEPQHAVIGAR